jgi:AcrR family transcriptional regulator
VKRDSYHHGDLRETLLTACLRLIGTEGIGAVSLRRVAREAGVSPGAPYHHFADRAALLGALAGRGFALLAAELTAAREKTDDPVTALTEITDAYVAFAIDHPAYFRLMFRPELSQPDKDAEAEQAGEAAFAALADTVADCVRVGALPADSTGVLTVAVWSLGHGIASLWLDGQLDKRSTELHTSAREVATQVSRLITTLLAGDRKKEGATKFTTPETG